MTKKKYSAAEVAAEVGTDAKTFRRFLRSPASTFAAAGSGARYEFTTGDLPMLKTKFKEWQTGKSKSSLRSSSDMPGLPRSIASSKSPAARAQVEKLSKQRVDRLEQQLLDAGLHISQIRHRERIGSVQPEDVNV